MKKKDLFKQLNNVKKTIKPDQAWKEANREILFSQINAQTRLEFTAAGNNGILIKNIFVSLYKPVLSLAVVLLVIFGGYIASVNATKNSLPGNFWYGVKLTSERVQVNLALNTEKKANLEIEFAQRRLNEIEILVADSDIEKANKKILEIPLRKFQESLDNVKSSLAKLSQTDSESAVKLANLVDEKTQEYVELLEDQQEKTPGIILDTGAAISVSKSTGNKALAIIIKEFELGKMNILINDVTERVRIRIEILEKEVTVAEASIAKIIINQEIEAARLLLEEENKAKEAEEAKAAAEEESEVRDEAETEDVTKETDAEAVIEEESKTSNEAEIEEGTEDTEVVEEIIEEPAQPEEVLPTIEEIKDDPQKAMVFLIKANDLLSKGSVSQSFSEVKQANDLLILVNKVIKVNSQYLEDSQLEDQEESKVGEAEGINNEVGVETEETVVDNG